MLCTAAACTAALKPLWPGGLAPVPSGSCLCGLIFHYLTENELPHPNHLRTSRPLGQSPTKDATPRSTVGVGSPGPRKRTDHISNCPLCSTLTCFTVNRKYKEAAVSHLAQSPDFSQSNNGYSFSCFWETREGVIWLCRAWGGPGAWFLVGLPLSFCTR